MFRLLLILALTSGGAALKGATPPDPVIQVPDGPPSPPMPEPLPRRPAKLLANTLYVIQADPECIILTSPAGLVKVSKETGPVKVRGQFVDGAPGTIETRTFTRPNVYFLDAAGTGLVELLVIPAGASSSSQVIRRPLDVDNGALPLPPAPPVPPPPADPFAVALAASYAQEPETDKAAQVQKLQGLYEKASSIIVNDPAIKTYGDLFDVLAAARKALMADTVLARVRRTIGDQLNKDLPGDATIAIDRAAAAKSFRHVASALGGLK